MAAMHFWGVEVKGKEPTSVKLDEGQVIHISQATLGELKKDKEPVIIHLKVGGKKLVMGVLNQNTLQLSLDLVLDQDFEISHNWKNGSVHFLGYDSDMPEEEYSDFSEDEADIPAAVPLKENGKPAASAAAAKAPAEKGKKDNKSKPEPKVENDDEDDSDDDEDDSEEDDDESDAGLDKFGDSDEDDDEDSSDEGSDSDEEETPKPDSPKKRSKAVLKTPEAKKAKLATPQKTDGKKGGAHTATPHPSKKAGKSGDKSSPKSKSGGKLTCGSCSKTFNNEVGLQSHTKAKHGK